MASEKYDIIMKFRRFFHTIIALQHRTRRTLKVYQNFKTTLKNELNSQINRMGNLWLESSFLKRKYPFFPGDLELIQEKCRNQIVAAMIKMYRYIHLIMVIRWYAHRDKKWNKASWSKVSDKLYDHMEIEAEIR